MLVMGLAPTVIVIVGEVTARLAAHRAGLAKT
jgi:hypothetical protein